MRSGFGTKVRVVMGSEGPKHDPYGYTEMEVTRADGTVVTLHDGLGEWVEVNGVRMNVDAPLATFERIAGASWETLAKAERRLRMRCRKCGCHEVRSMRGYPGEWANVCVKCGEVVSMDFNESEVI